MEKYPKNDFFMRNIVHESNTDIMQSSQLSAWVSALCGNPPTLDLTQVPGVGPDQMKVSNSNAITDPADLVLRVAKMNMTLLMGRQFNNSDIYVPAGSELLLKSKLERARVNPAALDNFISLLDLENLPDPGAAVASGERSLKDILRIRKRGASKRFRKWLRSADSGSARDLERMYVSGLGKKSFYGKLPTQVLRFAITKAADIIQPGVGTVAGLTDSSFVQGWFDGYTPKLFLDNLRKLQESDR